MLVDGATGSPGALDVVVPSMGGSLGHRPVGLAQRLEHFAILLEQLFGAGSVQVDRWCHHGCCPFLRASRSLRLRSRSLRANRSAASWNTPVQLNGYRNRVPASRTLPQVPLGSTSTTTGRSLPRYRTSASVVKASRDLRSRSRVTVASPGG